MEIKVSVRGLVEFLLRTGDIDNRKKSAPDDAMAEGSRIHRMNPEKDGFQLPCRGYAALSQRLRGI